MKKFLKSSFSITSLLFAILGLFSTYTILDIIISNNETCRVEHEEYLCWHLPFWVPLVFFIFAIIFFFAGKKFTKQINNIERTKEIK